MKEHMKKAFKCTLSFAPSFPACVVNLTVFASELGNALCVQCGAELGGVRIVTQRRQRIGTRARGLIASS
jgi:hypothetical protein